MAVGGKIPFTSSQEHSGNLRRDVLNVPLHLSGSFMPLIYWLAEAMWSSQNDDSTKSFSLYHISEKRFSEGILQNVTSAEIWETLSALQNRKELLLNSKLGLVLKVKMYSCMERNFMFNAYRVAFIAN